MLQDTRSLSENINRGLSYNRGLNAQNRGLYDISVKKTMLKVFKRDDLYDDSPAIDDSKKESEKETDVSIDTKENKHKTKKPSSSSSSSGGKFETKWVGSDTQEPYQEYKAFFKDEKEFMSLFKFDKDGNHYINRSTIENYIDKKNKVAKK